jgi:SAM-dependent methyltransferase
VLILDATCAGRHLWNDKRRQDTIYLDRRILPKGTIAIRPDWEVRPDVCADFTALPFRDGTFDLVVFDPPHIIRDLPSTSFLRTKYGDLRSTSYKRVLRDGFAECWRVLKAPGTLHFKWAESSVPLTEVLALFPEAPLFKNKHDVTWSVFAKDKPGRAAGGLDGLPLWREVVDQHVQ